MKRKQIIDFILIYYKDFLGILASLPLIGLGIRAIVTGDSMSMAVGYKNKIGAVLKGALMIIAGSCCMLWSIYNIFKNNK